MKSAIALVITIFLSLSVSGCNQASAKSSRTPLTNPAKQYIVLLDLSMSRSVETRKEGVEYLNSLFSNLHFGDRVTILQVQQTGLLDHPKHWTDEMPLPSDSTYVSSRDNRQLTAEQETVKSALNTLSQLPQGDKVLHTDLFTTLTLSGEYARDFSTQRTTIILLSDMLQSSNGIEMEHLSRMPKADWIDTQKKLGLIPKLPGACIVVVGADATTREGAKIRDFWQAYFAAAEASLPSANYRATPPTGGNAGCEPNNDGPVSTR